MGYYNICVIPEFGYERSWFLREEIAEVAKKYNPIFSFGNDFIFLEESSAKGFLEEVAGIEGVKESAFE
ncbi:MAG: hypothetical protein OQK82_05555 [Candidatus Pacearchaeota archaeon]|nr:hypothetical protein [Candidatus Pacearchaeota archaeon]